MFLINLLLHYLHFRNLSLALVVFSGIPVAFAGGMTGQTPLFAVILPSTVVRSEVES